MFLAINGHETEVTTVAQLRRRLAPISRTHWSEIDLHEEEDAGESGAFFGLFGLINADRALLVCFRYVSDPGLTSRDPTYAGPNDAMLDFVLSNGQADKYPALWTIPTETALRAFDYALTHHAPDPRIAWNDETQRDGWQEWREMNAATAEP